MLRQFYGVIMDIPDFKQIYRWFRQRIPTSEIAGHAGLSETPVGRVVRFLKSASHQVSFGDDAAIATQSHQYQPSRQTRRNLCVPDWETNASLRRKTIDAKGTVKKISGST